MPKQISLRLTKRHEGQERVQSIPSRFIVIPCGRRWGKTEHLVNRAVERMLKGQKFGYWAPDFGYTDEFWRRLKNAADPIRKSKDETKKRFESITGGSVQCFSLHDGPDAGRSLDFDEAAVDEAGLCKNLEEAWTESIRPALIDRSGGATFVGTPKGRDFFHTLYQWGQSEAKPDWSSYTAGSFENPYLPESERLEMMPPFITERAYRQEICAEFLQDGGGVFGDVSKAIMSGVTQIEPQEGLSYRAGIDLAKSVDYLVVSVFDSMGRQCHISRWQQIPWPESRRRIKAILDKYNCIGLVDATGAGDPTFDELKREGCRVKPFVFTQQSREHLLERIQLQMENAEIQLLDNPVQRLEFESFEWVLRGRNIRAEVPGSMHDDLVMAAALAVYERGSRVVSFV